MKGGSPGLVLSLVTKIARMILGWLFFSVGRTIQKHTRKGTWWKIHLYNYGIYGNFTVQHVVTCCFVWGRHKLLICYVKGIVWIEIDCFLPQPNQQMPSRMFVRHTATISAPDEKSGEGRFCKDMWTPGESWKGMWRWMILLMVQKSGDHQLTNGRSAMYFFRFQHHPWCRISEPSTVGWLGWLTSPN